MSVAYRNRKKSFRDLKKSLRGQEGLESYHRAIEGRLLNHSHKFREISGIGKKTEKSTTLT